MAAMWLRHAAALGSGLLVTATATEDTSENVVYGHHLRPLWRLKAGYVNLNHGSYGAPPGTVLDRERAWQLEMEENPDFWFRYAGPGTLAGSLDGVRARLAQLIGAGAARDVVFVDGASGGVNAVLRSVRLPRNASVLYLNTAYQMVKNTMKYIHEHDEGEQPYEVNITIPSSNAEIVAAVSVALRQNPSVKLATFSHITSVPAIILPVRELTQLCHQHGVMVMIDGAHALGQIPVNVQDIGADFYVANGHKWLYGPKGSGILWVAPDRQSLVHPNVISYEGRGATSFQMEFEYTGTKDYSAFLAMGDALDFRAEVLGGEASIMSYLHDLATRGGDLLAEKFSTEKLTGDDFIAAMTNVRLPDTALACCADGLSEKLLAVHGTWVPVFPYAGRCYIRVSAQVYNDLSDFEFLAKAMLDVLKSERCSQTDPPSPTHNVQI